MAEWDYLTKAESIGGSEIDDYLLRRNIGLLRPGRGG
jgi:hypothetical protein